jgi:5-methylcytosine-specific restriction enzyme subunit McrC
MADIPIKNLYFLLAYAWDLLEEAEAWQVDLEHLPTGLDLLARLIIRGTQRLLKRGIDQGYLPLAEDLSTVRGRIDFAGTARRLLPERAQVHCHFEAFLPDLLHNQILKSTLANLQATAEIDARQKLDCHSLLRRMEGISKPRLRTAHFNAVRLHRNNAHYALLMQLCQLVHTNLLVNERSGFTTFRNFLRDKEQMAKLYEAFVCHFYRKHTHLKVKGQASIPWDCPEPDHLLPIMKADAILRGNGRTIVVECKFYEKTLQTHYLGASAKLHSGHLYQLSTYLLNLGQGPEGIVPEGLLVYPTTEVSFLTDLILSGKRIRACTLDLNLEPWERVAKQMLGFLDPPKPAPVIQSEAAVMT